MVWLMNNWYLIVAIIAAALVAGLAVWAFLKLPTSTQIEALKEWLKYAVTMAEEQLGSGTGQLKLRLVYEWFVSKFTWLARCISFETFSGYVDDALVWLRNQLESNASVAALVNGESTTTASEAEATNTVAIGFTQNSEAENDEDAAGGGEDETIDTNIYC